MQRWQEETMHCSWKAQALIRNMFWNQEQTFCMLQIGSGIKTEKSSSATSVLPLVSNYICILFIYFCLKVIYTRIHGKTMIETLWSLLGSLSTMFIFRPFSNVNITIYSYFRKKKSQNSRIAADFETLPGDFMLILIGSRMNKVCVKWN